MNFYRRSLSCKMFLRFPSLILPIPSFLSFLAVFVERDKGDNIHDFNKLFLMKSSDVDRDTWDQISTAVYEKDLESFKKLFENGADVNIQVPFSSSFERGKTVLITVAEAGNLEMVKFLVENGANVNLKDAYGASAINRSWQNVEILSYLIEHGACITYVPEDGRSILGSVMRQGNMEVFNALMDKASHIFDGCSFCPKATDYDIAKALKELEKLRNKREMISRLNQKTGCSS